MEKIKIGLQIFAVREDFDEHPAEALQRIADIGYQGVEMIYGGPIVERGADFYAKELAKTGLECFSMMFAWSLVEEGKLDDMIEFCKKLKCPVLVLGGIAHEKFAETPDYSEKFLKELKESADKIRAAGLKTGFHNHDYDHLVNINGHMIEEDGGGKSIFDYIIENTDDDYMMMVDTGNAQGGGADPIEMVKKYPHRTEYVHFKGYSTENGYLTPIWEAELDSDELIRTLVEVGDTKILSVEFGRRGDYVPFERAEKSYEWLSAKLREKGLY